MPNTLVHLGVQGLLSRAVVRDADLKWVYLGAIIPDLPWIVRRIVLTVAPAVDPYALRYYVDVQASLFLGLVLAGALALLATAPRKVMALLSLNVLLHLLLDASQIKWGNGVHLFAPWSWELVSWGFFWPESEFNYILTAASALFVVLTVRAAVRPGIPLRWPSGRRAVEAGLLLLAYLVLPLLWLDGPRDANNHYLETRRHAEQRPGQYVELDRKICVPLESGACRLMDVFRAEGLDLERPATVSVRGVFVDSQTIRVIEAHVHHPWFRDTMSYIGLTIVGLVWMVWFWLRRNRTDPDAAR